MVEPPCTKRDAQWCERSATQRMVSLLLDQVSIIHDQYLPMIQNNVNRTETKIADECLSLAVVMIFTRSI